MKYFFLFIFLFLSATLLGQRYSFVEYSTPEGLPQSQVTRITQDHQGYMWVGTLGGLAKFNGKNFKSFTSDDGLFNNKITFLSEINSELWVGHEGGVSLRNKSKFQNWALPPSAKDVQVSGIIEHEDYHVISTNGEGLFKIRNGKLSKINFSYDGTDRIRVIKKDFDTYYIGTKMGVYTTKNFQNFKLLPTTDDWSVSDISITKDKIYICTFTQGLRVFDVHKSTFLLVDLPVDFSQRNAFIDQNGQMWLYSQDGILILKGDKTEIINDKSGLPIKDIRNIFQDDEGNMWLGSLGKGLLYFPGETFVHYNQASGMPTDLVLNINQSSRSQYWIGTYDKGLLSFDKTFKQGHDKDLIIWTSAIDVNGFDWFGSESGLIQCKNGKTIQVWNEESDLLGDKITCLFKVNSTKMFVAGSRGLQLYNKGHLTTLHDNDNVDIGTIRKLANYKGILYLASDKGLYSYENQRVKVVQGFLKTTFCITNDNQGNLWIGTDDGLYRFDGQKIFNENVSDEIPSRFINFLNYSKNELYVGTNNGLYLIDLLHKDKRKGIKHFGIQEGVINLETNINSGYIDLQGNFWFGTASGLMKFKKDRKEIKQSQPRLILQNILVNYESLSNSKGRTENIHIPANKNNVSFEFDGISFSNPEGIRYQYWLEGAEDSWSPTTINSSVAFTGLGSGDYILHARAVTDKESFSKELTFSFTVLPPFYFTWWFITLSILLLVLVVIQIFRFRIQRERENNEKEKMVFKSRLLALEQQSLNASMNRHFIFNSLNSIQYFINTQDKLSANKFLTNFAQLIRKNLDSAGNEGNMIPLSKELERLKLYLSLESMRFKDKFTYEFIEEVQDTDSILLPAMLLQPFVENSIVHGILPKKTNDGLITVRVTAEGKILMIHIIDNGIGISNSLKTKENFVGDHRSQGMEITAKRIELIKKISNQAFEIIGPRDSFDENRSINGTYVLLKIPFENLDEQG